jgi:hypothetical protein
MMNWKECGRKQVGLILNICLEELRKTQKLRLEPGTSRIRSKRKRENNAKLEFRVTGCGEVDVTGSGSCPTADYGTENLGA